MENFYLQSVWRKTPYFKHHNIKICLRFLSCLLNICKKIDFFISQGSVVTMPKVRWALSYAFCSKFYTLSSRAKVLKIG